MNKSIESYIPLVDFLENILGRNSEIVLHDFHDLSSSVVDIRNGSITGREVGSPATDFALRILSDPTLADSHFLAHYSSRSSNGKPLSSGSFFIREENRIVGMLCVNTDTSAIERLAKITEEINQFYPHPDESHPLPATAGRGRKEVENFASSPQHLVQQTIESLAASHGKEVSALSPDERIEVIRALDEDGVFLLKGIVPVVAEAMAVSEPSIYRYLQKVRRSE